MCVVAVAGIILYWTRPAPPLHIGGADVIRNGREPLRSRRLWLVTISAGGGWSSLSLSTQVGTSWMVPTAVASITRTL